MDFSPGQAALLQALALMSDSGELASKIASILDNVREDKSRTVQLFCEVLALQKDEVDRKKKCVDLLEEVSKWWALLVSDREKLLVTISTLEMEKDHILKRQDHPREIYSRFVSSTPKTQQLSSRSIFSQSQVNLNITNNADDFVATTLPKANDNN